MPLPVWRERLFIARIDARPDDLADAIGKPEDSSGDVGGWRVLVKNGGTKFDKLPAVELVPSE